MDYLRNKKVVFIAPEFFSFDKEIENALLDKGALVTRIIDRPFKNPFLKALVTLFTRFFSSILSGFYIKKIKKNDYDYIFVINGQTVSRNVLKFIRKNNPKSKLILYMWDSLENRPNSNEDLYDIRFSFDDAACEQRNFQFRPLFYGVNKINTLKKSLQDNIAISFIGTAHSDRYEIVQKVSSHFKGCKNFWFLYLQAPWVFYFYKLTNSGFRSAKIEQFKFNSLSRKETEDILNRSEIVLDIEHPNQSGLTIRTFETIKAQKKMITTNKNITRYDFYNYGNILVIDRYSPSIPSDFINKKFNPYGPEILYKYSINGWIDDIFNLNDESLT